MEEASKEFVGKGVWKYCRMYPTLTEDIWQVGWEAYYEGRDQYTDAGLMLHVKGAVKNWLSKMVGHVEKIEYVDMYEDVRIDTMYRIRGIIEDVTNDPLTAAILVYVAMGYTYAEISGMVVKSVGTIKNRIEEVRNEQNRRNTNEPRQDDTGGCRSCGRGSKGGPDADDR